MSPNFSCWASSLKVILIPLQSLPVLLSIITFSVAFHSFYHSVITRISSGLHILYLYWASFILRPLICDICLYYQHFSAPSQACLPPPWYNSHARLIFDNGDDETPWGKARTQMDDSIFRPNILAASYPPRVSRLWTASSPFSIIRLYTVKRFPLKPPSFFKARLYPLALPDPWRVKLHALIWFHVEIFSKLIDFIRKLPWILLWPPQFRLCNIFSNFSSNFSSNLPRSTGRWADSRLQCSSRPNEAWLPSGRGTSYSECL